MNRYLLFAVIAFWFITCFLNYVLFDALYTNNVRLHNCIVDMNVRLRNILFRIFVLLGPVSLAFLTLVGFILGMYKWLSIAIKWLVDIDNENITEF